MQHNSKEECIAGFQQQFEEGAKGDRWMAAVWSFENGRMILRRTTCQFPRGDMLDALRLIDQDLTAETQIGLDTSPLPVAEGFAPKTEEAQLAPSA